MYFSSDRVCDFISDGETFSIALTLPVLLKVHVHAFRTLPENWMGMPQHDASYIPMSVYTSLLRFRLGAWALEVNRPNGRLREQRWCRVCNNADSVEDEYHVVMECPAYTEMRAGFAELGMGQSSNMLQIMSMQDQLGLVRIIHSIRMRRSLSMGRT
ncbi:hypothetical protein Vafri_1946 [Volvox africanus]|nr:hypothetical protein Vafri_1946 [Volvox africanus]